MLALGVMGALVLPALCLIAAGAALAHWAERRRVARARRDELCQIVAGIRARASTSADDDDRAGISRVVEAAHACDEPRKGGIPA